MVCKTLTYDHADDILASYIMHQSSWSRFWHHCIQLYSSFWTNVISPLCKAFHLFNFYSGHYGIKMRERNINFYLPLTKASCLRNTAPNATSLSHKNMVISGNQVYPY